MRDVNQKEFRNVFEIIRNKTNDFTEIRPELFLENPQFLIILRCCLGLSQRDLNNKLDKGKQFVRHFEAGRQGFKIISNRILVSEFFEREFLRKNKIEIDDVIKNWRECRNARNKFFIEFPKPKFKLKRIFEMTEKDFIFQFNLLKKETKNFTSFDPNIIVRNPRFLVVFRVIFGMNINKFSSLLKIASRHIRKWESFEFRMMPESAISIMIDIEELFKEIELMGNVDLKKTLKNFKKFSFFEPDELIVKKILESNNIPFNIHSFVRGFRKEFNVDFSVPNSDNPSFVIEVTSFLTKRFSDIERRLFFVDHRFQLLKIENPNLMTIFAIKCRKDKEFMVKNIIRKSVVNSDFCFVNDFSRIPNIIKI
ncbi:MAG: hypothetical protein COY38_01780 [Candidatus Aenigmarchaeota archaeon CG_4_10_14_0_8_um_filter_37_24]|nr:MAG: hypothetical protein AUJ50_00045 [Candidatus Aenigmarchaeota archaeon CG1_02_38_14]PIV68449.1 MAG: hypothetical protein COS07_04065 [Candidatus Aenigmarchaeota archaeon CG01_land_8_20_14_3_00_37_9]PIW40792.1 MAG: hypothetical protein COW21_05370 [Candidatus Aenigmarchaeota archaeon CG15_BIG_FIL_POST_REV_8_21_14_020_37_27]PIX50620.1 MAG: hypothetical protein COZ52_03340 [Candidatus Aenigmarchaeota archaeon CG_4_8_14_3_um_filter_37_24]PIY35520.1 MAG: hypothetical protein COZ04_03345 [Cand